MIRVLIVDDKPENLFLLRSLLQDHGYAVEEARHGAEALAKARLAPPQVVISDLLMSVMDGYTLLRHWKADAQLKTTPFIIYTATYTQPKDEKLALDLGADAFILKPAETDAFVARLREVLAKEARGEFAPANAPAGDEQVLLEQHSETLGRKLEERTLQLEQANRALHTPSISRRVEQSVEAEALTPRQREVLKLIAEGRSTRQIAERLHLSVKTVETHRAHLMQRLEIFNVAGLTRYALRIGLIDSER